MRIHYFIVVLLGLASCQNVSKAPAPESLTNVSLICQSLGEDEQGLPHTILLLGKNKETVTLDTLTMTLNKIPKEDYAKMDIPTDAIDACGGWYAGGGSYFYVVKRDGKAVVFEGFQEEQQEDKGYHWAEYKK
jgi:hypothetical protein